MKYKNDGNYAMIKSLPLERIMFADMQNNMPQEIDSLCTHVIIDSISITKYNVIEIADETVKLIGSGIVCVELQFGSHSDCLNGDGLEDECSIDFTFEISVDLSTNTVIEREYDIHEC